MDESNVCPACGSALPLDAPRGLCPPCLLEQGLGCDRPGSWRADGDRWGPDARNDWKDRAEKLGRFSHVVLRDTWLDDEVPLPRMTSGELPGRIGETGRYELFGEITRGGMGAIFKGRDPDLGRDLAVKVLLETHCQDPDLVRRFFVEAQIGGQLEHPGIVPVHDLGTFPDDRPYFTMKLVKGRTLAALLGERRDPADDRPRFLAIFEQVCQTIAYAHARGVIHRDLKPGNVMVAGFGEVHVMDWGLAKLLDSAGPAGRVAAGRDGAGPYENAGNGNGDGGSGPASRGRVGRGHSGLHGA